MRYTLIFACTLLFSVAGCSDDPSSNVTGPGGPGSGSGASSAGGSGSGASGSGAPASGGAGGGGAASATGISASYPGDVGIENDPAVVWAENCEEGDVGSFVARYDDAKMDGISLDGDVSAESSGAASCRFTADGAGPNAVDVYKNLGAGYDEIWVRWYARYEAGVPWHHTGMWIGGYAPPSNWPSPQAGLKPNGDDRFHFSFEPLENGSATPRMDFYAYWMTMHSWMDQPSGPTAYYGNSVVHDPAVTAKDAWQCFEVHLRLNPDPSSPAGAELGLWIDDVSIIEFTDQAPLGYWVKDKFCPDAATGTECTDYKPANPELVPLDLQVRSTTDLKVNAFWPQNYVTDPGGGSVWYDDMIVATARIGCIAP